MSRSSLRVRSRPRAEFAASEKDPCEHLYAALYEFVVDPTGKLTHFAFLPPTDCRSKPAAISISPAWRKTACVMFVLAHRSPAHIRSRANLRRSKYSYIIFDSDRPNTSLSRHGVWTDQREPRGTSPLGRFSVSRDSASDGSAICDGEIEAPAA